MLSMLPPGFKMGMVIAIAVLALVAASAPVSTNAQRRDNGTNNFFSNTLDSGTHPCMSSRLYFILDFGPNAGKVLRPFIPVQVNERLRVSGYALLTVEDLKGSKYEGTNPPIIFIEDAGKGERGGWLWPAKEHCITGDPTPPENGGELLPGDFPPE
jgi:hypothetical protein